MKAPLARWNEHYASLEGLTREGNGPRTFLQEGDLKPSIVLVHGLTDSPHYMDAIGRQFYEWGFNVWIPLLPYHGLKEPESMRGVEADEWVNEVEFALETAREVGGPVSVGGLSTGGTLSLLLAIERPELVSGAVFLFSAALDLQGSWGNVKELLLRQKTLSSILARTEDRRADPLIGDNPYKYARMDIDGASQLAVLIKRIEKHYKGKPKYSGIAQPVFIAHSEADKAADIQEMEVLFKAMDEERVDFFRLPADKGVAHASLVLAEDVTSTETGNVVQAANPHFDSMMEAAYHFARNMQVC